VPQDRLRKLTDDNRELANNLKRDLVQPQPTRTSAKPAGSSRKGKGQGSDLGSGRGSEERHSSVPAGGRGTKRGKDNDVEKVGSFNFLVFYLTIFLGLSKWFIHGRTLQRTL
jgi:mortality factor 4-like protein 1